jgi:hypothetical protein
MLPLLAKTILCAGSFAGFFFCNGRNKLAGLALLLILGLPLSGEATYTKISLFATLCGAAHEIFGPRRGVSMIPFLFVNSVAVVTAFNAANQFDPTAFERMASQNGDSLTQFWLKHCLVHWGPVYITFFWLVADKERHLQAVPWDPMTGVYTAAVHLAWALLNFGSLDLSSVYVKLSPGHWDLCWSTAVFMHLVLGCSWRWMVRFVWL